MKYIAQFFLAILFIVLFILVLLTSTLKFALLNYNFWSSAFTKHDVYSELSSVIKSSVDQQVDRQGGTKSDVSILTDLVTPENTKDFVNNNLTNFIDFLNGKSGELIVYVPINRAPKGLLPKNISELNNEMTVSQLGEKFDIGGLDQLPFDILSRVGPTVLYAFIGSAVIMLVFFLLLILTTEVESRFVAPGIAVFLSGIVTLLTTQWGAKAMENVTSQFSKNTDLSTQIFVSIVPSLAVEIINLWIVAGIVLTIIGVLLMFIKKP